MYFYFYRQQSLVYRAAHDHYREAMMEAQQEYMKKYAEIQKKLKKKLINRSWTSLILILLH